MLIFNKIPTSLNNIISLLGATAGGAWVGFLYYKNVTLVEKQEQDKQAIVALKLIKSSNQRVEHLKLHYKASPCFKKDNFLTLGGKNLFYEAITSSDVENKDTAVSEENRILLLSPLEEPSSCPHLSECIFQRKPSMVVRDKYTCFSKEDITRLVDSIKKDLVTASNILSVTKPEAALLISFCQTDFLVFDEWFLVREIKDINEIRGIKKVHDFLSTPSPMPIIGTSIVLRPFSDHNMLAGQYNFEE